MSLYTPTGGSPLVTQGVARIERRLPHPGNVVVRPGRRVEPEDVVARAFIPAPLRMVNIVEDLDITRSQVPETLRCEVGATVMQGDTLAQNKGIGGKRCRAPIGGVISAVDSTTGYIAIAPDPIEFELRAGIRGIIMEELPNQGVIIETPAAVVTGAFGYGSECIGVLRLLVTDPSEPITADLIDVRSALSIVIGGSGITAEALRRAVKEAVRGVIVGSIDEHEWRDFLGESDYQIWQTGRGTWQIPTHTGNETKLTIVVTEGFGQRAMSAPMFDLLSAYDRQEALLESVTSLAAPIERPRVMIPLTRNTTISAQPNITLRPGMRVRLLNDADLGDIVTIRSLPAGLVRLPSGVRTAAVEVQRSPDEPTFFVPRAAVEALA